MLPCSEFDLSLFVQISSNECSIPPFFFVPPWRCCFFSSSKFVFLFGGDLSSPNVCGCGESTKRKERTTSTGFRRHQLEWQLSALNGVNQMPQVGTPLMGLCENGGSSNPEMSGDWGVRKALIFVR